ncbi:MAG: glycosyltransferase family 2 protein [Candidatus Bathyarchaeota archaeon]|nr:glycosyltransferase family 2 protein [Candidatus Bathyarchaeota archaeon]
MVDLQNFGFNDVSTQLIVAALNEEEGIGATLREFKGIMGNMPILVVDGNSQDRTVEVAKDLGADLVFQDGSGKGDAIAKGISLIDDKTKYVVLTDADYTYPAEYVPGMIEVLEREPEVGMVCGNRFGGKTADKSFHRQFYLGNKMLAFAHNFLIGAALDDPLTGLRVIKAEILKNWKIKSKGFDIEVELNSQVLKQGYLIVEVPIKYRARLGEKKLKVRDGTTILKRIISESSAHLL